MSDSFGTPWTIAHQAPLSMGFPRQAYWYGLSFPSPGDLLTQGWNPCPLHWQVDSQSLDHQGSPSLIFKVFFFFLKVYFGIKIAKTNKEKPTPGFPVGKDLDLVEGRLRITNKPISGLRGLRTDGPAKGARLILPKLWVQRPGIQALNRSFCVLTLTC